ncbi:MAG: hypothetical protein Q4E50_01450 [Tissierellia bacterium]|nr:hypothetical protein [Tissierellia bacterium]
MKKKLTSLALLIFFVFLLASCSIETTDSMEIDEDFSGSRSIKISLDKRDKNAIKGGFKALTEFLESEVLDPLRLDILSQNDDYFEGQIVLDFKGLDDYIDKVSYLYSLSGSKQKPGTKFKSSSDRIFTKGMDFFDDVTSEKLLAHLLDRAVSGGIIKENNRNKVFSSASFSLIFKGDRALSESAKIPHQVNTFQYLGPKDFILSTSMQGKNTWTRVFSVIFSKDKLAELDLDWQNYLIKNPNMKILKSQEINTSSEKDAIIYKFALENASLEEIRKATDDFLQASSSLSLGLEKNTKSFSIDFEIYEKLENLTNKDNYSIRSVYYTRPKKLNEHFPLAITYMEELRELKDALITDKDSLIEGYRAVEKIQPKFSRADINTKINLDLSVDKEIKILKGSDFYANMGSELISKYLSQFDIQASDDSKYIMIRYGGEDFDKKNLLFFNENPQITLKEAGFLGYRIDYKDFSSLNKFTVDEIEQDFQGPSLSTIAEKKTSFKDGKFSNELVIKGTSPSDIVVFFVISLALSALAMIIYRLVKINSKKDDFSDKDNFVDPPYKKAPSNEEAKDKEDARDTQPIPSINNLDLIDKDKKKGKNND